MASGAQVWTLDALVEFRAALIVFLERAAGACGSLRQEVQRTMIWLEQEQPRYWQEQVRRAFDRVAGARTALETCRLRTVAGRRPACIEEQVALRRAKERLEYCQGQVEVTRRWAIKARDQSEEFMGRIGPLERALEYEVPQMLAALERMIAAIEAYADVQRPLEGTGVGQPAEPAQPAPPAATAPEAAP